MALSSKSNRGSQAPITSWLRSGSMGNRKRNVASNTHSRPAGKENQIDQEQHDLQLAIELSKEEVFMEQKRILERIQRDSNSPQPAKPVASAKTIARTAVSQGENNDDDDDDDFQESPRSYVLKQRRLLRRNNMNRLGSKAAQSRLPPSRRLSSKKETESPVEHTHHESNTENSSTDSARPIKREKGAQEERDDGLVIDDVSEWLQVKTEKAEDEQGSDLVIEDLNEFLEVKREKQNGNADEDSGLVIDDIDQFLSVKREKESQENAPSDLEIEDLSNWLEEQQPPPPSAERPANISPSTPQSSADNLPVIFTQPSSPPSFPAESLDFINDKRTKRTKDKGKKRARIVISSESDSSEPEHSSFPNGPSLIMPKRLSKYPARDTQQASGSYGNGESSSGSTVQCPLCLKSYPQNVIEAHAADCMGCQSQENTDSSLLPQTLSRRLSHRSAIARDPPAIFSDIEEFDDDEPTMQSALSSYDNELRQCFLCREWVPAHRFAQHVDDELKNDDDHDTGVTDREPSSSSMVTSLIRDALETVTVTDDESECSVIDLCNEGEEEDDGYLSPLEGYVSVHEQAARDPSFQRYFDQTGQPSSSQPRRRTDNRSNSTNARTSNRRNTGRGGNSSGRSYRRRFWRKKRFFNNHKSRATGSDTIKKKKTK